MEQGNDIIKPIVLQSYLEVQKNASITLAIENREKTIKNAIMKTSYEEVQILIAVSIASFQHLIGVKNKLGLIELATLADLIIDKYPYDTYQDIIVALKESITNGQNFYNSFSPQVLFSILNNYFDQKYAIIENIQHEKIKKTEEEIEQELQAVYESYRKMASGDWRPIDTFKEKQKKEIEKHRKAAVDYYREKLLSGQLSDEGK